MKLMGRGCQALLVAVLLLFSAATGSAREATLSAVIQDPAQFDGQMVTIRGAVATLKQTTSRRGNDYTTFKLQDPTGATISIFTWGHPTLSNGDRVEVEGLFRRVKRDGPYTFYNEVEAEKIVPTR
jgi:RecJ-like exonuclease